MHKSPRHEMFFNLILTAHEKKLPKTIIAWSKFRTLKIPNGVLIGNRWFNSLWQSFKLLLRKHWPSKKDHVVQGDWTMCPFFINHGKVSIVNTIGRGYVIIVWRGIESTLWTLLYLPKMYMSTPILRLEMTTLWLTQDLGLLTNPKS